MGWPLTGRGDGKGLVMRGIMIFAICCGAGIVAGADDALTAGPPQEIGRDYQFTEGPLWLGAEGLVFSDIPADTIYRGNGDVYRRPSGGSNGLALDPQGRLLACEHNNRRVTRTEKDGAITVLADRYEGKRLNSPNDLVVRSDGTIYFTDPPYGLPKGLQDPAAELDFSGVYTIGPDGKLGLVARDFIKPNGIGLSPDERRLYVADTDGNHIRVFDLTPDGQVSGGKVWYELPHPDGMAVDSTGRIWCTAGDGVHVVNPDGSRAGVVRIPLPPANCAFGGLDLKTLYVTARTKVFAVPVKVPGLETPVRK